MASRVGDKQGYRGPEPAEAAAATGKASKLKRAPEAADLGTHEGVARADVDEDPAIWNLNRMARFNLMTPEWIENAKKNHNEHVALMNRVYDELEDDDHGEVADEATMAAFEELCNNIFVNVDLTGLNTVGGESCGMDAVAVYPEEEEEDEDHRAAVKTPSSKAAAASSI